LRAAFYELGGRADEEGCEAACGTGKVDGGEGGWCGGGRGRGLEEGKRPVVGYEEESVEGAVAEDRGGGAYAGAIGVGDGLGRTVDGESSPLTRVPVFSKCCLKLRGVDIVAAGVEACVPACRRVLTRSRGLPMRMPAAPER
jgi:hypothetical protein